MGKRNKKRVKKIKCSNKASSTKSKETEAASSSNAEIKTDKMNLSKDSRRSDEMQGPGNFQQILIKGTDDKQSRNVSSEDDNAAEQSSQLKESDMTKENIKDMIYAINESMVIQKCTKELDAKYEAGNISSAQFIYEKSSLAERHKDLCKLFESRYRPLVENTEIHVISKEGKECVPEPSNIVESSKEMSEPEKLQILNVMNDTDKEIESKFENVGDVDGMITDLEFDRRKNARSNDVDISVEDIQKVGSSTQLINEKKDEKDGERSTGNIGKTENYPHYLELECDEEMLKKIVDVTDETVQKAKESSGKNEMNETVNASPRQNKSQETLFQEFNLFLKNYLIVLRSESDENLKKHLKYIRTLISTLSRGKRIIISESQSITANAKTLEIKASKEQEDQINEIIAELREFESKILGSSTGNVNEVEESRPNATEDKKEGKKSKNDDRSNDVIQDFHSNKEMLKVMGQAESCGKNDEDQTIYPKKNILKDDFKRDLKEFMKLQNSKMDDRVKKYREMASEMKSTIEQPDRFSSDKGPLIADAKAESHEKTEETTEFRDKEIEVATNDEQKVIVKELDDDDVIHFEIETNGKIHVFAGKRYYFFENKEYTFVFKNKNIQVTFTNYQIFVSTPDSEFDISIRNDIRYLKEKSNPFNLADKVTQTDDFQ